MKHSYGPLFYHRHIQTSGYINRTLSVIAAKKDGGPQKFACTWLAAHASRIAPDLPVVLVGLRRLIVGVYAQKP